MHKRLMTPTLLLSRTLSLILSLTVLFSYTTSAAELDNYYVVELTIFTYENPENIQEEIWPKTIKLSYPKNLAYFTTEDINTVYPELITLSKETKSLKKTTSQEDTTEIITTNLPAIEAVSETTLENNNDLYPPVFLPLLDQTYQKHKETLSKLKWSKKYNPIFNKIWLQKIGEGKTAPNIVIQAGEIKSEIYQLGGTINLYKSRYLHLKTDLWLVQMTNQIEEKNEATNTIKSTLTTQVNIQATDNTDMTLEEEQWPIPPTITIPDYKETQKKLKTETSEKNINPLLLDTLMTEITDEKTLSVPIERIVTMKQNRKMRSGEMHYLDHPLFGLLIEIRPYQSPLTQ